jgi:Fe2+ or Zn2+ uptake regulation protein
VEEFSADPVAYLKEALLQERGFAVTALQLDIAGMCRRCRDQGVAT